MSAGVSISGTAWRARISRSTSASLRPCSCAMAVSERSAASVRIQPGQTAFTRMPRGPSSSARERVRPTTACLLAA